MALNSYAAFTLNGTALSGDVTMSEIGGVDISADHIECHEVKFGTRVATDPRGGRASAHRAIQPVLIRKRIDQTTPLLYQGLAQNQRLDGDIKIFDTDPDSGMTRHRFTLRIAQARILAVESCSPDTLDAATASYPPHETLELVPHTIAYIDEVNSIEFEDRSTERT